MELFVGKHSGFCAGVKYTIEEATKILKEYKQVFCLGEIVHNEEVIRKLTNLGMITVNNITSVPDNSKLIIRAHGVAPAIYEEAKKRNIQVFDLTCGKIKIIHDKIIKLKDSFIIIIAKKNHPETIGTYGYAKSAYIVEDEEDISACHEAYKLSQKDNIYIISQTTFSSHKFDDLVNLIKDKFNTDNITVDKTICMSTENRQKEVIELSQKVDIMLIIGGKNSSNTKELYNLASTNCPNTYLIQTKDDITFNISKDKLVGIMAGASTDASTVNAVIEKINNKD